MATTKATVPATTSVPVTAVPLRDAFLAVRAEISKQVYEMDEVLDLTLVALLARQHLCLLGKPGAAKSKIIDHLTAHITGCTYFTRMLMKTSTPEELFGPVMLSELKQDRYVRNIAGKLPLAHVAFLDEVFKANSALLNSMLKVMNERKYDNDGVVVNCPLNSLFGASNEMPQEEGLAAMWDRFVLRVVVDYMTDESSYRAMFASRVAGAHHATPAATISLDQLRAAQAEVAKVALPTKVVDRLLELRRDLKKAGIEVSPRRWSESVPVLQAHAWLAGSTEVGEDDLLVLNAILWSAPEQRPTIRKVVNQVINPAREQAIALFDQASSTWADFLALSNDEQEKRAGEYGPKIRSAGEKYKALLAEMGKGGRTVPADIANKLDQMRGWHKEMVQKLVG